MKTPTGVPFRPSNFPPHPKGTRSAALLIVLGCLALISVLIVAFFSSVTTEKQSAVIYANTSSVKLLADSTVSIVMGKIKDATKGTNAAGKIISWASQPGMIRNYDTSSTNTASAYYKLYSWNDMVTNSYTPTTSGEFPPTTWMNSPAIYTDLNEPVSGVYPILDPTATTLQTKGFSISGAPESTLNKAPMPVKWLYALKNGQIIAPDTDSADKTAKFTKAGTSPDKDNPIVGRIAFWTDDDTCKVNINTAAGDVWVDASGTTTMPAYATTSSPNTGNPGSFWDTPRSFNSNEINLSSFQAANGEYQRYPGHPATTYLSAVFPTNFTSASQIYQLSPRVTLGGSYSGTTYSTNTMVAQDDNDRLYSSVDELLWSTNRAVNSPLSKESLQKAKFFITANSRAPEINLFNQPRIVIWPMSSTNNAAINLYRTAYDNLIAYCGSLCVTNSGTLTTNAYYFQRDNPNSMTIDLPTNSAPTGLGRNRSLMTYLRTLTSQPIPGFSTTESFKSKYDTSPNGTVGERDQILTEIFDYIRVVNTQDPTVTNSFTPRVGSLVGGIGQVVPITDQGGSGAAPGSVALRGFGHMPVITEFGLMFVGIGENDNSGLTNNFFPSPNSTATPAKNTTRIRPVFLVKFFDPAAAFAPTSPNFQLNVSGLSGLTFNGTNMGFPSGSVRITASAGQSWPAGYLGFTPVAQSTNFASPTSGFIGQATIDVYNTNTSSGNPPSFTVAPAQTALTIDVTDAATGTVKYQTYDRVRLIGGTFPVPRVPPFVTDSSHLTDSAYGTNAYADFRNLGLANTTYTTSSGPVSARARFATASITAFNTLATVVTGEDVIRTSILNTDPRIVAASYLVSAAWFTKITNYDTLSVKQTHGVFAANNGSYHPFVGAMTGKLVPGLIYGTDISDNTIPYNASNRPSDLVLPTNTVLGTNYIVGQQPLSSGLTNGIPKGPQIRDPDTFIVSGTYAVPANGVNVGSSAAYSSSKLLGDWDTGNAVEIDGGFINKVDEGSLPYSGQMAYFGGGYHSEVTSADAIGGTITIAKGTTFSPNRMLPSAAMFGSLSTGVKSSHPWQTLLFRPSPDGTTASHVGAKTPKDHLLLDLFSMPVVEPYAITDPFSTAGKINMNYQIVPFTYLTRNTGMQAVMRSEQMLVLPPNAKTAVIYDKTINYRHFIDINETLKQFDARFAAGDIFRSASEICDIWLVPSGMSKSWGDMQAFWNTTSGSNSGALTGDNVRERPYANLYPRLTTKSNSYTVHMRVQTLKKVTGTSYTTWEEGTDVVTGEYRGSTSLERYLDTSDTRIPDYATDLSYTYASSSLSTTAIDNYYKFRVVETKQFTP